eukprot:scaffold6282_cov119-Isochrysis_galbana.AAC.10
MVAASKQGGEEDLVHYLVHGGRVGWSDPYLTLELRREVAALASKTLAELSESEDGQRLQAANPTPSAPCTAYGPRRASRIASHPCPVASELLPTHSAGCCGSASRLQT